MLPILLLLLVLVLVLVLVFLFGARDSFSSKGGSEVSNHNGSAKPQLQHSCCIGCRWRW